ncbi:MAG: dodecin family protein [Acidimicrobiia bacterium]|nr:dodecin family protein [Acidimicrobiia bacterium]MDH5502559.1 dodecin family protein [Acidimicrobiia bacterium]
MSDFIDQGVVKIIEVIGISEESFEDAIARGVAKASESVKGITGVEVQNMTARVKDGQVTQYHANMKLAFAVK